MDTKRANDNDRLAAERKIKYRGTVRVNIETLAFPYDESRELDHRNVQRLEAKFRKEGYDPLPLQNHVVAEIDQQSLDRSLALSGFSAQTLLDQSLEDYPTLRFPTEYRLSCLHGRHRVVAAARLGARHWTVDLFLGELIDDLKRSLIEEYSAEQQPEDGELYRKVRHYQGYTGPNNAHFEARWWARTYAISKTKGDNMKHILRSQKLTSAFDVQMDAPGLSGGMMLGTIHKILALRCDEEVLNYLCYIREVWFHGIFAQNQQAMKRLDRVTVQTLDNTAPGAFRADRERLQTLLRNGQIFSAFTEDERGAIWRNVLAVSKDRSIPSFHSFFRDAHYLKGPVDCMKQLITLTPRDTVRTALEASFHDNGQVDDQCIVQESEHEYMWVPGDRSLRQELGIHQIQLWAFRNHLKMPPASKRQKSSTPRPEMKRNIRAVHNFASLARRLGFESRQIVEQLKQDPDEHIARSGFLEARDPTWYEYEPSTLDLMVKQVVQLYSTARKRAGTDDGQQPGRKHTHMDDEHNDVISPLFLTCLQRADAGSKESHRTFIRRSRYCAFFGKPPTIALDDAHVFDVALSPGEKVHEQLQNEHGRGLPENDPITQDLERCRGQLEQQQCKLEEQSQALKFYATHVAEQSRSLEERERQRGHVEEQWRQAHNLKVLVEEQQGYVRKEWDAVKEEQLKVQRQASSLREEERVFREQQQSASNSLNRCTALEEELEDLKGRFDLVHEQWRRAQESQSLVERQLHDFQEGQQHLLQRQEHALNGPKDSLRGPDQRVELLEGCGEVRASSSSDSVSIRQEQAVGVHEGALVMEVTNCLAPPITSGDRSLQQNVLREETSDMDKGFTKLSPIRSSATDQSIRYTEFDFTKALVRKGKEKDEERTLEAGTSGMFDPRNAILAATDRTTALSHTRSISGPLEIHFEILGDDGSYTLSQIVHADLSNMQAARSVVVKHLRKATAMIMQSSNGQIINADNFHMGMTTTEVNFIRFVPRRLLLSNESRAISMEDSDSTDQNIHRKLKGTRKVV